MGGFIATSQRLEIMEAVEKMEYICAIAYRISYTLFGAIDGSQILNHFIT